MRLPKIYSSSEVDKDTTQLWPVHGRIGCNKVMTVRQGNVGACGSPPFLQHSPAGRVLE